MSHKSIQAPVWAGGRFINRLALIGWILLSAPAWAQGFIDTTSGNINEKANGIDANNYDARSQAIINQFKKGRLSSAKDVNSRFSGHLEFHDSNQDGVIDHDVGSGNQGLEGKINSLLPSGRDLVERARKSREDANESRCGEKYGTRTDSKDGSPTYSACFNPSGIILDDGAAHGGAKSRHRKYKLAEEAKRAAEEAGEAMALKTIQDAQKAVRGELGGDPNRKVAALDLLRAEAVWAEDQKENQYERNWKTLRAARLAGYDDAELTAAGTAGFGIMHEVDEIISTASSKEEADQAVARRIAIDREMNSESLVKYKGQIVPYSVASKETGFDENQIEKIKDSDGNEKKYFGLTDLHRLNLSDEEIRNAQSATRQHIESNEDRMKNVENSVNALVSNDCMNADVWCHSAKSASAAGGSPVVRDPKAPQTANNNGPAAFDVFKGSDPGDIFHDTRELNSINAQKAMNAPVTQMKKILKNADFNEQTNPEVFEEIEQIEKTTKELQDAAIANGGKDIYNQDKQTLREMTGITRGVNDTFSSSDVDVSNRGPAGGGLRKPKDDPSSSVVGSSGFGGGNPVSRPAPALNNNPN